MENLKEVELMELTNDLSFKDSDENEENTSYIGNGEWELFYSDTKTLKAKEYIKFDTKLNTKGVYSLQFFVERAIATPGRNVTLDVRIKSPGDQIDLFQDEKILHPRFSLNKQEYNNWIMFIPVEEKFVDSLLCISYKSNALFNPIDITTIIRFFPGKDFEETMSLIEEYKDKHLNQSNKIIHQVVSLRLKKEMSTPAIYNPSTKNKSEENNEKNSKEEKKENSNNEKSTSFISSSSPTEKPTSQSFVFVEKTDSSDVENIVFENIKNEDDSYFEKKTVFEDFNCSVSNFSKYIREIPITPGVYALQLDINNKIQSPRRSLQITYKIFSHDKSNKINSNNSDSKQNLIEKFSQKQILLLKKNYIFLKPEIYSSGEDCTFWLKIKSPVLIPVKVDVKLIHTKNINKSENFLSTPMRQISEVKDLINDLVPVKKNVWSVQKSLYFKRSEIFEIELTPGVYTFFICKLDNLNISIRNFKCSASLYNDRYSEEKQCISLKTITHDLQIGDGENSVSENTVEFECETNCILRINMDASPMSPPIAFYARVQKLTKFDLKTLKHEGLNWAYYLFIFLGLFVFLKYIILSINFLACFKIFGFSFEYVFLIMFVHWFYTTGQFSNLKYYQSKMDELKLKSGFEKFKMFLKHAKNGEEERKLEILNRKFSENKIF